MKPTSRRLQTLTDHQVQGELLFRAIVYWFFCLLVISALAIAWNWFADPERNLAEVVRESLRRVMPAIFASVVLLPVVLLDVLNVSNRFVGPMHRVRDHLRRLAAGKSTEPLNLRSHDYWPEMATYLNAISAELETLRQQGTDLDALAADEAGTETQATAENSEVETDVDADLVEV